MSDPQAFPCPRCHQRTPLVLIDGAVTCADCGEMIDTLPPLADDARIPGIVSGLAYAALLIGGLVLVLGVVLG